MANENTNIVLENLIDINLLNTYNNEIISFINGAIAAAKTSVKSDIINGAPDTFDTLKEVSDYISNHKDEYDALMALVGGKVSSDDFQSAISRIVALETKVDTLTGAESVSGSVANQIKSAKDYADSAVSALENGQVKTNKTDIATLKNKVETLENNGVSVSLATDAQITAMFTSNS